MYSYILTFRHYALNTFLALPNWPNWRILANTLVKISFHDHLSIYAKTAKNIDKYLVLAYSQRIDVCAVPALHKMFHKLKVLTHSCWNLNQACWFGETAFHPLSQVGPARSCWILEPFFSSNTTFEINTHTHTHTHTHTQNKIDIQNNKNSFIKHPCYIFTRMHL